MVYRGWRRLRHWLFPGACLLCGADTDGEGLLCHSCMVSLPELIHACRRCGVPCATVSDVPCGTCQQQPPEFDRTHAPYTYAPPVDWLVHGLKYRGRLDLARFLGERLADFVQALTTPVPDVIVPVPLHTSRLRVRGYNQSLELARYVGARLRVPVDAASVRRVRATTPQMETPREKRRANVRGAFRTQRRFDDMRVAILDDVMTTGSTVNALAQCLRKAGASEIVVWVVARA